MGAKTASQARYARRARGSILDEMSMKARVTHEDLREKFIVCGLDELPALSGEPVTHVLSILDPDREEPHCFADYAAHARLTLRFHDDIDPGEGRILPSREHIEELLAFGATLDLSPEKRDHLL